MQTVTTKLAGVSFGDCQKNIKLFGNVTAIGISEYDLIREPDNSHDPFAVRVCFGKLYLGYLPRQVARTVASHMDCGENLSAEFVSLNRSPNYDIVGMTVRIVQADN